MRATPVVIGVDPGGATTGVVARQGRELLAAVSVSSADQPRLAAYLEEVLVAVEGLKATHAGDVIAVEDTLPPNPHLGISNPAGIIAAAQVLGAVLAMFPDAIIVRPGGHGAPASSRLELEARYPAELIGARETKGTGALRHVRSAWDVAGAATWQLRTEEALR